MRRWPQVRSAEEERRARANRTLTNSPYLICAPLELDLLLPLLFCRMLGSLRPRFVLPGLDSSGIYRQSRRIGTSRPTQENTPPGSLTTSPKRVTNMQGSRAIDSGF